MLQQQQPKRQQQLHQRPQKKLQKKLNSDLISIIIVGFKEPRTIGDCIKAIAKRSYSGIPANFELIQVSPDDETLKAGKKAAQALRLGNKFKQIVDPRHGKPYALKLAFKKAKGSILLLTDGDTKFSKGSVKNLLNPLLTNEKVGGVTGRPF
ncbi:MAG TPA: glycosyltransferase, partial [Candidatus Dojkabacteria bacterium]|nr:glycosyltransferase [Candidatus Dojkabacteria bacterium]